MRACLILCLAILAVAGEPTLEQRIAETARALIVLQRPDGGWGIPHPPGHEPCPTRRVVQRRDDDPPLPPVAPEHVERGAAPTLCRAAEALWLARASLEPAAAAAAKAQSLAARALLAHRGIPPDVVEAVAYLRAEQARGGPPAEGIEAEAARLCRIALDAALDHRRCGGTLLGVGEFTWDVDLRLSWLARPLDHREWHCWLPRDEPQPWGRIERRQSLTPPTWTEAGRPGRAPRERFEDGSPFAVALDHADPRVQAWMKPLCEAEDMQRPDPLRLRAWAEAFLPLYNDPPEAWWRDRIAQWDQALRRRVQRHASPAGPILLWDLDRVEDANPDGVLWLSTLRRIAEGEVERDWQRTHIAEALIALAAQQAGDGSWPEGPGETEATALACLAFLGAGYDHKTPNRHKRAVRDGLAAIRAMPAAAETRARALRLMALAEAYAMTSDPDLRRPTQDAADTLIAARLPGGGWSALPGGPCDWPATTTTIMALRSAYAGGIKADYAEAATWWPGLAGDGAGDSLPTLAWKATAGVFLGKSQREQSAALSRRLVATLEPKTQLDPQTLWIAGLAIFQLGGDEWLAWERRLRAELLPPAPTPGVRAMRLMADEITYRYAQVRTRR